MIICIIMYSHVVVMVFDSLKSRCIVPSRFLKIRVTRDLGDYTVTFVDYPASRSAGDLFDSAAQKPWWSLCVCNHMMYPIWKLVMHSMITVLLVQVTSDGTHFDAS